MDRLPYADERQLVVDLHRAVGAQGRQGAVVVGVLWPFLHEGLLDTDDMVAGAGEAKVQGVADLDALQAHGAPGLVVVEDLLLAHDEGDEVYWTSVSVGGSSG